MKREKVIVPEAVRYEHFFMPNDGSKHRSLHSNEVFLTKKDRRIYDRQFLQPRVRTRGFNMWTGKRTRRAKVIYRNIGGKREEV